MKRKEISQYTGNPSQMGGSRHYVLSDGWGRNLRGIDINCGNGLQYTIMPDRGMDISLASYKGTNLVYITPNGETHPSFYEPENLGWLRTFSGGLLTTCGLTYLGAPVTDGDEKLGLHGRYSTIPARQVADLSEWIGDEYHIRHKGIIEESHLFGNKLRLVREISSVQGQNILRISDTVSNFGNKTSPFTILYHMNLGYPLLSEDAELLINPVHTDPATPDALAGIAEFKKFSLPQQGYREQVFLHTMKPDSKGKAEVTLQNPNLGISLAIKYNTDQLPCLTQWKMMGHGDYVLGIEPGNVHSKSRVALKENNQLPYLEPGESITTSIEVVLSDV